MATGVGDLVSHLEADNSDFVAGMEEAANEVENVTLVIHEQRASWSALAQSSIPAIGEVTSATLGLVGTLAKLDGQEGTIAGISGAFAAAGSTVGQHAGLIARAAGYLVPQWKTVATAVDLSALAWKGLAAIAGTAIGKITSATLGGAGAQNEVIARLGGAFNVAGSAAGRSVGLIASAVRLLVPHWKAVTTAGAVIGGVWKGLATIAVPAIVEITSVTRGLASALATIERQHNVIARLGGAFNVVGSAAGRSVGLIARAVGFLIPQWKMVTTAVAVTAIAWKAATSDVIPAIDKQAYATETVSGATSRLGASLERLGSVAASPIRGAASAMSDWWNSTNLLKDAVDATTGLIAAGIDKVGDAIDAVSDSTQQWMDIGATALYAHQTDATDAQAQAFYEEAQALRDLNVETLKAIAAAERRLEVTRAIGGIQNTAKDAAAAASEVDRIRTITTLEGIEAQRVALQQLAREQTLAGKSGEAYLKQQASLFNALEQQAEAIKAGKVQPEGMKEAESALKALDAEIAKLTGTYEELAEARRRDGGAGEEILGEIRQREELKKAIEAQKEAEKLGAKQLEDDTRRQNEAWDSENEKIASLKDQLDLLTGAATKADIERRKALEAGFTDAGAEEIAALTEQLDAAQAKERQKSEKSMREQSFEFATKGSSAAFSAIFKAENRGGSAEERTAKAAEKTAQEIGKTNDALAKLITATEQNGLVGMEIGGDS